MQYANELFSVVAALILWGLVISSKPLLQQSKVFEAEAYWYIAFVFTASAYTFFAIASTVNIALLAPANACFFGGNLYLGLFCRSLRKPFIKPYRFLPILAILVFGLIFEYIRQKGTFTERVFIVNFTSCLCLVWQLIELGRLDKAKLKPLKFFLFVTSVGLVFAMVRLGVIFFIDFPVDMHLYQEPFKVSLIRWSWFSFSVISYVALIGFWIERLGAESALTISENYAMKLELANKKVEQSESQFLTSLNALSKARDNETGNHIIRTQLYVKILALRLRSNGLHVEILTDEFIDFLYKASPLHDIGKVGIPDSILLKNGPLTDEEWVVMKTHTLIGESVLDAAHITSDGDSDVITKAIKLAGGHHEKWHGNGYPRGLAGQAIPLEARIMSIADNYDALVSNRPYKKAWSHEQAVQEIISKRATHFDPLIVDAFIAEQDVFRGIARTYQDG